MPLVPGGSDGVSSEPFDARDSDVGTAVRAARSEPIFDVEDEDVF